MGGLWRCSNGGTPSYSLIFDEQPAEVAEDTRGRYSSPEWNKLVYDPDGRRALIYDRWVDKKHGGGTIYGNCLFAFDPERATLSPLKIDNWAKIDVANGGYRTKALPENEREPTPVSRHVLRAGARGTSSPDYLSGGVPVVPEAVQSQV